MPMYEYCCSECQHTFEVRQKFSDQPVEQCPRCGGAVKKLISRSGFALKGGGWFEQSYCSSASKSSSGCAEAPSCPSAAAG